MRDNVVKTVAVDGREFTLTFYKRSAPRWVPPVGRYGRGYMDSTYREYDRKPRLYPSFKESLYDNLVNRTSRPSRALGKLVRPALKALGYNSTIGWSQTAGCSCPCSPGWVWTNAPEITFGDSYPTRRYDAYITAEELPQVRDDETALFDRLGRAMALDADPTLSNLSEVAL